MRRLLLLAGAGLAAAARLLGRAQTLAALAFIYFGAIGVTGPLARLFSGDPLDRRLRDRDSVWSPRDRTNRTIDEARRLF